jgi:arabinogalactan endo-1,4-beta-galactosidase
MRTSGVTPSWVQIGNETNMGICVPIGSVASNPGVKGFGGLLGT